MLLLGGRDPMAREGRRRRHGGARHHVSARPHHVRAGRLGHRAGRRADAVRRRERACRGAGRGGGAPGALGRLRRDGPAHDVRPAPSRPAAAGLRSAPRRVVQHVVGAATRRSHRAIDAGVSTGLRVEDARLVGRNQLRLQVQGRPDPFVWRGADTIFAGARALGVNTGLAGFFLPYCAMVGDSVTTCEWQPCVTCGRLTGVFGNSLGESMWHQASELLPQYRPPAPPCGLHDTAGRQPRPGRRPVDWIRAAAPARAARARHLRPHARRVRPPAGLRRWLPPQPGAGRSIAGRAARRRSSARACRTRRR